MRHLTLIKSELSHAGGLEKWAWKLAEDFCQLDTHVTLLTSGDVTPLFTHPNLTLHALPLRHRMSALKVYAFDRACTQFLAQHPTPLIFGLDRTQAQTHLRAGNGVHAAYLQARAHEEGWLKCSSFMLNPLHQLILHLERKAFENPQLQTLFTNSHMVRAQIQQFYRVDPKKIQVVHNGVEWKAMQADFELWHARRAAIAQENNLDLNQFQLLFVGHNFRRKGLDKLLTALVLLPDEPFQLSVVGHDKHLPRYKQLAKRLGLEKRVRFFGPISGVRPFYQVADALAIPSIYDPFANVTVEALAMGLFVISSKYNGGCEVLTPSSGAVIENLDSPESFAAALKMGFKHPKTPSSAQLIRSSVAHLDFSKQLRLITQATLRMA